MIQSFISSSSPPFQVTVESDRKQLIARASPLAQQQSSPPLVAPKPFGKTITEYRTIRMIGNVGDIPPAPLLEINNRRSTSIDSNRRLSSNSNASHEDLMESIRRFGGSQNLGRK